MKEIKKLEKAYADCQAQGLIQFRKDVDKYLIESLLTSSIESLEYLEELENIPGQKKPGYFLLFTNQYDILRKLIQAFLLFDRLKCSNHQCVNAYLCTNHPKLKFKWETLEEMRMLRNKICYEGRQISLKTWNLYKLKFEIYIKSLIRIVKEKLSETK
ncbi:hypothetical protein KY348_04190 [Candidatus Woesearchaeota archaeon]|nr:hypothetical protein [Candidatus Woesearchaeota archaeon]